MLETRFQRTELKYLISKDQKELILDVMKTERVLGDKVRPYMQPDNYHISQIRNIYFDTPNYRLIRRSLEKPLYKEKLRLRSYKKVKEGEDVFVELKKKYDSVVYKRRILLPEEDVITSFAKCKALPHDSHIASEIDYFRAFYKELYPAVFLSYDRESWAGDDGLRITFDNNILFRNTDVSLKSDIYGMAILHPAQVVMEIKANTGMPLWLVHTLSSNNIYKTSFSKYGTAFIQMMENKKERFCFYG